MNHYFKIAPDELIFLSMEKAEPGRLLSLLREEGLNILTTIYLSIPSDM